ncbi:(2E,6E)-farnesyl diphosphate synthase (plasmid) [Streptomyces sp. YIM 121038]|uniref:polyprenyl synthetase family protein n=1 Tax=Streptomyces sp. YIM 121038 TaxID=2136401 RepID=UPI00110FFF54|nr:polyprenyl synthetase family protein [Streptomyces sp. YIM 121038]QCX82515.1 (2E,6E)-farnesyl diphosphate synthase [Streptomyces sp. YIM 121038]
MTTTGTPAVAELFAQARHLMEPELRAVVTGLHPKLATIAGYHMGLLDRDGRYQNAHGGKLLRPALTFLAARTVGAQPAMAMPGAVAIQLGHEFSLIHDDITDRDRVRRGRPTVWTVWGIDLAILAGDAVHALAETVLADHPRAAKALADGIQGMCAGQADDFTLPARSTVTMADYQRMVAGKTGALIVASCQLGALLADAEQPSVDTLTRVGAQLGFAYQAVDDWLGIWGDPAVTGKPVGADIAERKPSLPIITALAAGGPAGEDLATILATDGDLTEDHIASATALLSQAGADLTTRDHAHRHAQLAAEALDELSIPVDVRRGWDSLITFMVNRIT